jgi:GTP-binding protein
MGDLQEILLPYVQKTVPKEWTEEKPTHSLKLAIIGRPNVGKSTLVNSLLGEERQLTADVPGVTRDAISLAWTYKGQEVELIDTAGIRRKSRIDQNVEKLAVMDAERSLRFAEIVILVIDGSIPFEELIEKQDLTLASHAIEDGRGLIFAINKWDQVKSRQKVLSHLQRQLDQQFSQAKGIACIPISALNHKNLETLMDEVFKLQEIWNKRLTTGELNRWLQLTTEAHPAPAVSGRRIRLKYITQIKNRPPTFIVFCTKADDLPDSYKRYLINTLRQDFSMPGVPIRLSFRASKNPYAS